MDWDTTATQIAWYRDAGGSGPVVLLLNVVEPATMDADLDQASERGVDEVILNFAMTGLDVRAQCAALEELVAARA